MGQRHCDCSPPDAQRAALARRHKEYGASGRGAGLGGGLAGGCHAWEGCACRQRDHAYRRKPQLLEEGTSGTREAPLDIMCTGT